MCLAYNTSALSIFTFITYIYIYIMYICIYIYTNTFLKSGLAQGHLYPLSKGGDLAPSLGGTEKKIRRPRFLNEVFFSKKISIFTPQISDDLFLFLFVIDRVFQIFPIFFQIFHIFTACNVVCDPSSREKPLFQKIIP